MTKAVENGWKKKNNTYAGGGVDGGRGESRAKGGRGAEQIGGPVKDTALFGGVHSRVGLPAVFLQKHTQFFSFEKLGELVVSCIAHLNTNMLALIQ